MDMEVPLAQSEKLPVHPHHLVDTSLPFSAPYSINIRTSHLSDKESVKLAEHINTLHTTCHSYQQLFNQMHTFLHSCPLKIISVTAQPTKSSTPHNIVDLVAHLLYNTNLQESPTHPHPTLCEPCSTQARYAAIHADYSALMFITDHKSLINAIADTSKQYPTSTFAASQTILSQLEHKPSHRIALFTGADTPTKPAPLSQLSS